MLSMPRVVLDQLIAQALDEAPLECCGLLAGHAERAEVARYVPCRNAAASARVYTVEPRDQLRATRAAEDEGLDIIGVVHSHTHTPPHPSATDIAAAPDPTWHYVIVSLAHAEPSVRSYRIVDAVVQEEPIALVGS